MPTSTKESHLNAENCSFLTVSMKASRANDDVILMIFDSFSLLYNMKMLVPHTNANSKYTPDKS